MIGRAAALAVAALLLVTAPAGPPPRSRRAVIYLQPGSVPHDRQMRACITYCDEHAYDWDTITGNIEDAVAVAVAGDADLVLTAFSARSRPDDLRTQALHAGVRVEYVRPPQIRREIAELIATIYRRNKDPKQLAAMLGDSTDNMIATLKRLGIWHG